MHTCHELSVRICKHATCQAEAAVVQYCLGNSPHVLLPWTGPQPTACKHAHPAVMAHAYCANTLAQCLAQLCSRPPLGTAERAFILHPSVLAVGARWYRPHSSAYHCQRPNALEQCHYYMRPLHASHDPFLHCPANSKLRRSLGDAATPARNDALLQFGSGQQGCPWQCRSG